MKKFLKLLTKKENVAALVFLIVSYALVAVFSRYTPYLSALEGKSYDFMMSVVRGPEPTPKDIVIVGIDDSSLQQFADNFGWQFPWPRAVYAELIRLLNEAGARSVTFDMIFDLPSTPENDTALTGIIQASKIPVILGATQGIVEDARFTQMTEILPVQQLIDAGSKVGYATLNPGVDSVLRKARLSVNGEPGLALQTFLQSGRQLDLAKIPVDFEGNDPRILVHYVGRGRSISTVSFYQALDYQNSLPKGTFAGKAVFVGRSLKVQDISGGKSEADAFATPFDPGMPGVEIHANILWTLLSGKYTSESSPLETWLIILFPAFLITGVVVGAKSFRLKIIVALSVIFGWAIVASLIFIYLHHWVYTIQPLFMTLSVFGLNTLYQYRASEKERAVVRRALKGYVSSQVMDEVLKNHDQLQLGGAQVVATVLFSDIAGFSKISEKITPKELSTMLNDYFTKMGDQIMKRDGMINKYIGDAIMALWGVPLPNPNHALLGCQSALAMKRIVDGMAPMKARIGLNTGLVVAGNLGHIERMEYTVIGDAVNLASRLEGANKGFGTAIMISEFTAELVRDKLLLRQLDVIRVIGKQQPIRVFELIAEVGEPQAEQARPMVESFQEILDCYGQRDWGRACEVISKHLERFPEDSVAQTYLKRCKRFLETPPAPDWDGVYALESK